MAESKSANFSSKIKGHSENVEYSAPNSINRLGRVSEWSERSNQTNFIVSAHFTAQAARAAGRGVA
jgi:hypothetical protein